MPGHMARPRPEVPHADDAIPVAGVRFGASGAAVPLPCHHTPFRRPDAVRARRADFCTINLYRNATASSLATSPGAGRGRVQQRMHFDDPTERPQLHFLPGDACRCVVQQGAQLAQR